MQLFKCKLLNKDGNIIDKYIFAKTYNDLKESSSKNNIIFISAKKQKSFIKSPYTDFTIPFLKNLSQLVENKFNLLVSLEVTAKIFNNIEASLIIDYIINDIKQGVFFSEAISKFDRYFDEFTIKNIEISEKTAKLAEALKNVIEYLETDFKIHQKIKSVIKYPTILLISVVCVFFFWMFVIVPKFAELFSEMQIQLSFYTKIVIKLSNFLINNIFIIFLLISIFSLILIKYAKLSNIYLKIPALSKIRQNLLILNFFTAMNIMIKEKINLIDCLYILENRYPKVKDIIKLIKSGTSFSISLIESNIFPNFDISIIETAEKAGNLSSAFQTIITLTRNYIENKLDEFIKLIPILAICFVGIFLIIIVCSLVIPMYSGMDLCF